MPARTSPPVSRTSPTVRRRRLGIELRRLREAAGLTIDQVAERLECSLSKISRIEKGQVSTTTRDVRDLLEIYGLTGEARDELIQLAREARQSGWWKAYSDTRGVLAAGMEAEAATIRQYEALLVPGLLQTADYARALLRVLLPGEDSEEIERRVQLRLKRQAQLTQDDPPTLWVVLDEAALWRPVGGTDVMREQLLRLAELAQLRSVTLQVLPFAAGEHAALDGAFTILGFPEQAHPDIVYVEHRTGDLWLENPKELDHYKLVFERLHTAAFPAADSASHLVAMAEAR
jgi:transcriptional regulator with XRE-family HTH domain